MSPPITTVARPTAQEVNVAHHHDAVERGDTEQCDKADRGREVEVNPAKAQCPDPSDQRRPKPSNKPLPYAPLTGALPPLTGWSSDHLIRGKYAPPASLAAQLDHLDQIDVIIGCSFMEYPLRQTFMVPVMRV